ncbi:MAG: hypothetical protein KAU01_04480 [Candidatus Cloacimonetes bacterium]|nr:hypothetical protein [Candidatus Cloacimonadota bacterium]
MDYKKQLGSIKYWEKNPNRINQRFYIAFCLLMSSIHDTFIGLKEKEQKNLNWSVTCSYYALIHAGRLLTFLALGDYPTQHNKLRDLYNEESSVLQNNWLSDFIRVSTLGELTTINDNKKIDNPLNLIYQYFEFINVDNSKKRLKKFGELLYIAAKLRNDSNYESLLIAHEYYHNTISKAFEKLANNMTDATKFSLELLIDVFTKFVENDPIFQENRDSYKCFLYNYSKIRIYDSIKVKLSGHNSLITKLGKVKKSIQTYCADSPFEFIEESITMNVFKGKGKLMENFQERIDNLSKKIKEK